MTGKTERTVRILGSLRAADGAGVVHIEDRYDTNIDDLWTAITDPGRLARWYGDVEGDLRPGGTFRLHMESNGWDGTGRVEACEPPRRLRVMTRESDESYLRGIGAPPFDEVIEATLTPDGHQTLLQIQISGMPIDKVAAYGAGWQIHAENLAAYLGGGQLVDSEEHWSELLPPYQDLASQISPESGG